MPSEPKRLFRDRLTGRRVATPPVTGTLVGRWVLERTSVEVFVNSAAASEGDFLTPEPSGRWHVLTGDGQRETGTVARAQVPDELEAESVRTIGDHLEELTREEGTWRDWVNVVPLVPGISEEVDLHRLELRTRELLGHLETVCRKPRAHLQMEVQRVSVSKARRIPPAAVSYLAAHTEDWDRPLMRGILPKRILAEVREDQVDIYENRVAARLVDHLSAYLSRRLNVVRRLLKVFQEKKDYSPSVAGTYQRGGRMSKLWGESIDANEGRTKAEATLRELEWLKYKVMGLLGSPLYEEVPRRALVPTTLKSTNILTNDQHYRRVAELWREWARTGAGRSLSPAEFNLEAQRLCRGLDAFAMLLTIRALDTLGYTPVDDELGTPIARGMAVRVRGKGSEFTLEWRLDGSIAMRLDNRELSLVTLAADLAAGKEERVRESLRRVREADSKMLVLFLASDDRDASEASLLASLHTVGNDLRPSSDGGGCLPISPWEIGSTERVARALRWFLDSARFADYPRKVSVPEDAREIVDTEQHARWIRAVDAGAKLELRRPPQDSEWDLLNLESLVQRAESDLEDARGDHERLSRQLRDAVDRGRTGSLARRTHNAHEKVSRCERVVEGARALAEQLREARVRLVALLDCPTCGAPADAAPDFEPRDRGCFRCVCRDCGTEWATRLCGEGHRYAAMLPSGKFIDADDRRPGWVDRTYGCDVLAVPARRHDGGWGFVCPTCGEVS